MQTETISTIFNFVLLKQEAKDVCEGKGLENTLLDNCVFDVLMTNDTSFADQQSLEIGKNTVKTRSYERFLVRFSHFDGCERVSQS